MHVAVRARLVLARRPWIYWAVVAALATIAAVAVHGQLASIEAERDRWGTSRSVLVATRQLEPGDVITAELVALPVAALPAAALVEPPTDAVVRQRVAAGEVLTELDIAHAVGPAALAEPGLVVVALSDPLARNVAAGQRVKVAADGVVLADQAEVTEVIDDVIFVAVPDREAVAVAAAAQHGSATLLYLP
jgi:flagella basal body P-ring formation protein FlgA